MKITLPWPDKRLSPNARLHWRPKAALTAKARADSLLAPRFYTTDFAALEAIDVSPVRAEWDAVMAEYEGDNNHDHFQRDAAFAEELKALPPELHQEFIDFLISSITSEFSGCVLYNEIQKNVANVLERDAALKNSSIKVKSVNKGTVILSGKANSLTAHQRALADARSVEGVRKVASEIQSPNELADKEIWNEEPAGPSTHTSLPAPSVGGRRRASSRTRSASEEAGTRPP